MSHADLIARLEKLEGPSVYLDEAVWEAVGGWPEREWRSVNYMKVYGTPLTASIDAAVALVGRVLPGWKWLVSDCHGEVFQKDPECGQGAYAPTPALALLIATLLALQEKTQ